MSYDISLKDPVTKKTIELNEPHFMRGGTYAIGGTKELWINVTYNYGPYYYEATDKDPRFAHDEVSCYYSDGTKGPVETEYGIRGIYGKNRRGIDPNAGRHDPAHYGEVPEGRRVD